MSTRIPFLSLAALAVSLLVPACEQRPADPALPTIDVRWTPVQRFENEFSSTSIWASSMSDIYVGRPTIEHHGDVGWVGEPAIFHFDGGQWSVVDLPIQDEYGDTRIWGAGPGNVYAAVERLYHFDGSDWSVVLPSARYVAGSSATNVFAADWLNVFHFDGVEWDTLLASSPPDVVREIYAGADGSLWMSTPDSIRVWNGASWQTIPRVHPYAETPIAPLSADDAFALLGDFYNYETDIYRWNGTAWGLQATVAGLLGSLWTDGALVHAVGDGGAAYTYDGTVWRRLVRATGFDLYCVTGAGNALVAAGSTGKVVSFENAGWHTLREGKLSDAQVLWAESSTRFLVSYSGVVFKRDGGEFSETVLPYEGGPGLIGGRALDDVFAWLWDHRVLHYNGSSWSVIDSLDSAQRDVWTSRSGQVFTAGDGSVYRFDGTWQRILEGEFELRAISGDNTGRLLVAGIDPNGPIVRRFDGSKWAELPRPSTQFYDVLLTTDDMYAAGSPGLYRWNGSRFERLFPKRSTGFSRLFQTSAGVVAFGPDQIGIYDGNLLGFVDADWIGPATQTSDGTILAARVDGIAAWKP